MIQASCWYRWQQFIDLELYRVLEVFFQASPSLMEGYLRSLLISPNLCYESLHREFLRSCYCSALIIPHSSKLTHNNYTLAQSLFQKYKSKWSLCVLWLPKLLISPFPFILNDFECRSLELFIAFLTRSYQCLVWIVSVLSYHGWRYRTQEIFRLHDTEDFRHHVITLYLGHLPVLLFPNECAPYSRGVTKCMHF